MSIEAMKMALHALNIQTPLVQREFELRNLAIEALRQAIEQAEKPCQTGSQCIGGKCPECEQVEKPVAWLNMEDNIFYKYEFKGCAENDKNAVPLYTAPPKREWVGLTDEEAQQVYMDTEQMVFDSSAGNTSVTLDFPICIYRAIEAKLKEKNN